MISPSVFVSDITTDSPFQEVELGRQLIADLEHARVKVIADDGSVPDSRFLEIVQPALKNCAWFILIQTAAAMNSLRVQVAMSTALQQVRQHTMRGVIRIVCPSSEMSVTPPMWSDTSEIPFTGDYPRVRDKILLEMDLLKIDDVIEKTVTKIPTSPLSSLQAATPPGIPLVQLKDIPASMITPPRNTPPRPLNIPGSAFARPQVPPPFSTPRIGDRSGQVSSPKRQSSRFISLAIALFVLLFIISLGGALIIPRLTGSPLSIQKPDTPNQVDPNSIAQDTFHRANHLHWGNASDGQQWGGEANTSNSFSIANDTGKIQGVPGVINYNAILGPVSSNSDVTLTATMSELKPMVNKQNGADIGVILRWHDPNNWYKAFIDGSSLMINKHSTTPSGNATLRAVLFKAQPGKSYTIRFRAIGNTLAAKAWPSNQAEPKNWMATANDSTLKQGQAGLRATLLPTATLNVSAFEETKLNS